MAQRRPDLEALPYKNPGFLTPYIMPSFSRDVKAGTFNFDDILADGSAQTDRTLATAATAYAIASASSTFSMAEKIHRAKMDESEIEQLGGLDKAQAKAARKGKRTVMTAVETLTIAATFGDEANINSMDILTSFLAALDIAKEAISDYSDGKIVVFGARKTVNILKRINEIVERMKFTGVLLGANRDVRSISDEQLAAAIDVDMVLAGPSTASAAGWFGASSAYAGWLGVMVLPDGNVDPDEEVQFGRMFEMPVGDDGGNIFKCESYYSDDLKSEVVDTVAWVSAEVMNKECCFILKGIDEENTTTTTTTTTGA